ncbi:phosphotransferase [Phycicoccus sp. BSK3Z-2]|uniref:Phosphotransferase n=1 Tax=Phycicoccus avicenniae TaxID=2828860 RepID=A0A941DA14_9MICO|nr:phosphotransferase [Phycicoccus avicenniae]MBR7743207.1 phosphotransferase [Phycicoccus avicenniae]
MRDLPALWASAAWRDDLERWLLPALDAACTPATGPVEQVHVRFWSTVLRVPTAAGAVWVKENAPSQAFEASLVHAVDRFAPGRTPPVVAAEPATGRLATRDAGTPLGERDDVPDEAWVALVSAWGGLQRDLADHGADVLATGITPFPEREAADWAAGLADRLAALPPEDPRRLSGGERRHVEDGLALVEAAADALSGAPLPDSLQHNDLHLGNALAGAGGAIAFIDLGDAVWAHPLTALRIPLWTLAERRGADDPFVRRVRDAALEPWADLVDAGDLRALLPAADRLSALHRVLSWQRLVDDVPLHAVPDLYRRAAAEWLLVATDPDPYDRWLRS